MIKKTTKILSVLAMLLCSVSLSATAAASYGEKIMINEIYKLAQRQIKDYKVALNENDNSVEFTSKATGNTDYWVTASEATGNIALTMHMRGYNISAQEKKEFLRKKDAAYEVKYRAKEKNEKVNIEIKNQTDNNLSLGVSFNLNLPASSPEAFVENFSIYCRELSRAKENFQDEYKNNLNGNGGNNKVKDVKDVADKNSKNKKEEEKKSSKIVLPAKQKQGEVNVANKPFIIQDVRIRNLNDANNVIRDFGADIPARECQFLEFETTYMPNTNDKFAEMAFRLYNPDGQLIVEDENSDFSFREILEIKNKGAKKTDKLTKTFGTDKPGFWRPGTYRLVIFGNGIEIANKEFELYK